LTPAAGAIRVSLWPPPASGACFVPPTIDDELNQLEKDIRQLQIEYDTYF